MKTSTKRIALFITGALISGAALMAQGAASSTPVKAPTPAVRKDHKVAPKTPVAKPAAKATKTSTARTTKTTKTTKVRHGKKGHPKPAASPVAPAVVK